MSLPQLNSALLFTLRLDLDSAGTQVIGVVPGGQRINVPVRGGSFEGPQLRGQVLPGADSVLLRDDGATLIDVRLALKTDDGAVISVRCEGLAVGRRPDGTPTDGLNRFRRRELVPDDELYIRATPRFETGDGRYGWLNTIVAVSKGSRDAQGPFYQVFEIF